jgi:hypothetical protein
MIWGSQDRGAFPIRHLIMRALSRRVIARRGIRIGLNLPAVPVGPFIAAARDPTIARILRLDRSQ